MPVCAGVESYRNGRAETAAQKYQIISNVYHLVPRVGSRVTPEEVQ